MKVNHTLDAQTLLASNTQVKEVTNRKTILTVAGLFILSGGMFYASNNESDNASSLSMSLLTLAIAFLVYGIYLLLCKRSNLMYIPTQSDIHSGSHFFDRNELEEIKKAITTNNTNRLCKLKVAKRGNARIDYMYSADGNFVSVQLYEYVPYTFEPSSDIISFTNTEAQVVVKFLKEKS